MTRRRRTISEVKTQLWRQVATDIQEVVRMTKRERAVRRVLFRALTMRDRATVVRALESGLTAAALEGHMQGRITPHKDGMPPGAYETVLDAAMSNFIENFQREARR